MRIVASRTCLPGPAEELAEIYRLCVEDKLVDRELLVVAVDCQIRQGTGCEEAFRIVNIVLWECGVNERMIPTSQSGCACQSLSLESSCWAFVPLQRYVHVGITMT
jgi:hypothetical protein